MQFVAVPDNQALPDGTSGHVGEFMDDRAAGARSSTAVAVEDTLNPMYKKRDRYG